MIINLMGLTKKNKSKYYGVKLLFVLFLVIFVLHMNSTLKFLFLLLY